ncbi:uncharacterized protein LOC119980476 [Tripterygium wilfordii]|uniref:uncharacterized protein LOC119980476 n=1 Tax=Tripterygium wilfordii TaxID=458696 RepID=UPI0018F85258|nr:uncharacterized protein LOC119980476 [Tripterygium wilfordii]
MTSAQSSESLAAGHRMIMELEERYQAMITGLNTFIANIAAAAYPNVELPPGLVHSPMTNSGSPQDASSAPRVNVQRSFTATNIMDQHNEEGNEVEQGDHDQVGQDNI